MNARVVFLDRDNTIIHNDGDLGDPANVQLIKGSANAIASLRGLGFRIIVVTNQGGVARGKYTEQDVDRVHQRIAELMQQKATGAIIDRFYYCPFHPEATVMKYKGDHPWRKPRPGMLNHAAKDMNLDMSLSWMVGDQDRDIVAGQAAGCRTIRIGNPKTDSAPDDAQPDFWASSLIEVARIVAQHPRRDPGRVPVGQKPKATEPITATTGEKPTEPKAETQSAIQAKDKHKPETDSAPAETGPDHAPEQAPTATDEAPPAEAAKTGTGSETADQGDTVEQIASEKESAQGAEQEEAQQSDMEIHVKISKPNDPQLAEHKAAAIRAAGRKTFPANAEIPSDRPVVNRAVAKAGPSQTDGSLFEEPDAESTSVAVLDRAPEPMEAPTDSTDDGDDDQHQDQPHTRFDAPANLLPEPEPEPETESDDEPDQPKTPASSPSPQQTGQASANPQPPVAAARKTPAPAGQPTTMRQYQPPRPTAFRQPDRPIPQNIAERHQNELFEQMLVELKKHGRQLEALNSAAGQQAESETDGRVRAVAGKATDFSMGKMLCGLLQMLAVGCLLMALLMYNNDSAFLKLGIGAVFLQLLTMTIMMLGLIGNDGRE